MSTGIRAADRIPPAGLGAGTLCEAFQLTANERADAPALAGFGSDQVISWRDYATRVQRFAAGLNALGVEHGDVVCLMMVNRPEFMISDAAAMHLGAACCSIYNTSAVEHIAYVLQNAQPKVVVAEQAFLPQLLAARQAAGSPVLVVSVDTASDGDVLSATDVEAGGGRHFDFESAWRNVQPHDVLCLIHTSGTTGPPKAVQLTHRNMLSKIRGWDAVYPLPAGGRTISFLPHAHVADRWSNLYTAMVYGNTIYCVADANDLFACAAQVHPTAWGGVPRIWEKAKAKIEATLASLPDETERQRAAAALAVGRERVAAKRAGHIPADLEARWQQADRTVFAPLRELLGMDQAEVFGTGAAPTPLHVLEFFAAMGVEIADMWGLSEASGNLVVTPPGTTKYGTVGKPLPGVELRIDADGEILLRAPMVMRGYLNNPEASAEVVDDDGWLRTGDLGVLDDDGFLRIVGRKKELIINAAGKNMSPNNIEAAIKAQSALIEHAVAIGDARPYNVALIVLQPDAAARCEDPDAEIRAAIDRANPHLARVEQIKRFRIIAGSWQPGGPYLTMTSKLRRQSIADHYSTEIEELYT
jgi:long-chain acyl-CoA synthetase